MFKKLRIKFIAIIMVSVAVVLAAVFISICANEYQQRLADVHSALDSAIERTGNGRMSSAIEPGPPDALLPENAASSTAPQELDAAAQAEGATSGINREPVDPSIPRDKKQNGNSRTAQDKYGDFALSNIGGRDQNMRDLVPVAVYEFTSDGTLEILPMYTNAAISDELLESAQEAIANVSEGKGELSDLGLIYSKRTTNIGTFVAFADTSWTSSWKSLALNLFLAGLATLAIFFVISLFLSKWALKPVNDAWDSQRQFVADASHELKTPLTVILANASILLKHPESTIASQSQWIESTQTEAESMQGLVSEMLELAQVEERATGPRTSFDLSDLVDGVTLTFESVAFENGSSFECSVEENLCMVGDVARIRKMISTLVENALKYVDEGGLVRVDLARDGARAQLSITNTGSYISAEDLPHIFDRFYRTDKARTSGTGGYGLGLAIAKGIALEHGGDITCTSTQQEGTTFSVTLPLEA